MRVKTFAAQLNGKINEWDDSKCEQKRSTWHKLFGLTVTDSSTPLDYNVISIAFLRLLQSNDKCSKDYDKILKLNTENTLIHLYIVLDSQRSQKKTKRDPFCVFVLVFSFFQMLILILPMFNLHLSFKMMMYIHTCVIFRGFFDGYFTVIFPRSILNADLNIDQWIFSFCLQFVCLIFFLLCPLFIFTFSKVFWPCMFLNSSFSIK